MRYVWGLILASGLFVGQADTAQAQFSISIGNPYLGNGLTIGNPGYGYGYGYNSYTNYGYGNGIYGAPVIASPYGYSSGYSGYSSGYNGYAPVVRPAVPYYGGYRNYGGYGYRNNFRPNWLYRGFR